MDGETGPGRAGRDGGGGRRGDGRRRSGGERRAVAVYAPGGYHWMPARGDEVLVLKSGAEGAPCVVGRAEDDPPEAGAVRLSVCEGTSLVLRPGGGIVLTGEIAVTGRLTVNGTVVGGEEADG